MKTRRFTPTFLVQCLFWVCALAAVFVYQAVNPPGWDLKVYRKTMQQVADGQDPYAPHAAPAFTGNLAAETIAPTQYLYPPITLPMLAMLGRSRIPFGPLLYWILYAGAVLLPIGLASGLAEKSERTAILFVAPAALFFPGLLQHDNFLSGNLSFLCYGAVLGAAAYGWKHKNYIPFYVAVLAFSSCKTPWLTLLLLPVLLDRKQWIPASATATAGVATMAAQRWIWPIPFQHFLGQVEVESQRHGFGVSPAGILAGALFRHGYPYLFPSALFYCAYAVGVLALLIFLARRFQEGELSVEQWVPLLLIGVFLLNPRIKDYDVAPLTVPLGLTLWRFCEARTSRWNAAAICCGILVFGNAFALTGTGGPNAWNLLECGLLAGIFGCGAWQLSTAEEPGAGYETVLAVPLLEPQTAV